MACKNCGEECDGLFCSHECAIEWEDGKGDYEYEVWKDRQLEEEE